MLVFNKKEKPKKAKQADLGLIVIIVVLLVLGLISLSSASSVWAYSKFGDAYYYFKHQLFGLSLGLVSFWFLSRIDYHIWKKYAKQFLIFSIFLLTLVFIPGLSAHYGKARSWIDVFGFSLQPAEFVKLSFLLYLSAWLEERKKDLQNLNVGLMPFLISLGAIAVLMLLQPDLGTLIIISSTALIVYYVGGGSVKYILGIIILALLGLSIMVQLRPYQLNRFKCMIDPSFSASDICYQTDQSLIAVGSGGVLGRGLGASRQKFMYLPEVSGDSIFAIMAEEDGWIISSLIVICYLILFYKGYSIAKRTDDDFGKNLAIGIVSWITIQAVMNIGGIISLIPMTGVPLPLVSYGGSAILANLSALGVLVNISKYVK